MCYFSILCRKRVAVGWGLDENGHSLGGGWLHLQNHEMAGWRSDRKSYLKRGALQQLTCLIGNDEYVERIMKW